MLIQESPDNAARFWFRQASGLALKLNFHHWLARLIPKLFVVLVAGAIFELFRRETSGPVRWIGAFFLLGPALVGAWAWLQARRHFCTRSQALVRLETVLGLHNRLSAAEAGMIPWPRSVEEIHDGYTRNWKLLLAPLLAGILLLEAAHLVPVGKIKAWAVADPVMEPPEMTQVQNWIDALKAEDLVQPEKLQNMQSTLDKLRDRPPQDWYTQDNLEAANSLRELTAQSMNTLSQDLDQADQTVQAMRDKMEQNPGPGQTAALQPMQDQLRRAGENLASGNLPLKRELVDQLRGAEKAADKTLTADQLKALHDRLAKGKMAAKTAPKSNGGLSEEMKQAMAQSGQGEGNGRQRGKRGMPGGTGGGKETAPLELESREKITTAGSLSQVNNDDMSRAVLGETLKVSAGEHTVDSAAYHGNEGVGAAQVQGSGGQAVWRSTYDPLEADTLSRFFK